MSTWTRFNAVTRVDIFASKSEIMTNKHPSDLTRVADVFDRKRWLVEELHKPMIKTSGKRKVYFLLTTFGVLIQQICS